MDRPDGQPFNPADAEPAEADRTVRPRTQGGTASTDVIQCASVGTNADVFPSILELYAKPGAVIADTTYGKGVFWQNVPLGRYTLRATDLMDGTDARTLPYADGSLDMAVFDPPYMHGKTPYTTGGDMKRFDAAYRNTESEAKASGTALAYHRATIDLYVQAAKEASRVLKDRGVYVVKCQDEVCANRNYFTHMELPVELAAFGFRLEDIFIVVRRDNAGLSRVITQIHARKNASYFLILIKDPKGRRWSGPP